MGKILEFLAKDNRWAILLVILLIIVGGGIYKLQSNKISNLNIKYDSEVKLKNALTDKVHTYQDKEGKWVTEKLTIQGRVEDLLEDSARLTKNQKSLLNQVNDANKENTILTAALFRANFVIDSLIHTGKVLVDTANKTVEFIEEDDPDFTYDFKAFGVLPYPPNTKPLLLIKKMNLPNEQFIKFQWNKDKRADYPVSFSVTNSNKHIKVYDVNSYAIPTATQEVLNPTNWQKFGLWVKKNDKILKFIGGVAVGTGGTFIIMK